MKNVLTERCVSSLPAVISPPPGRLRGPGSALRRRRGWGSLEAGPAARQSRAAVNRPSHCQTTAMAALCVLPALALLLLHCCPPALPETMVGAYQTAEPQSEGVQGAAAWATQRYNLQSNCHSVWGLCGVLSARTQIVAGVNYDLEVKLCPTVCTKNQKPSDQWNSCELAVGGDLEGLDCHFIVWDVPWEETKTLTSWSCKSTRTLGE